MSAPLSVVLERLVRVAPFGLGLWDTAGGRLVSEGLSVRIFRLWDGRAADWVPAVPNRRGVFVAHDLPDLSDFEAGPAQPYLVEVRDPLGRFTSFVLRVDLPATGLIVAACMADLAPPHPLSFSPPARWTYLPLFSAPPRTVPAGMAAVRATLLDAGTREPAESAVLEVRESGSVIGRGIADRTGQVMAVFPYPEPPAPPPPASPPGPPASPSPLSDQTWSLDVAVRYRRDLPRYRTDDVRPPLADLCEVVQQPLAAAITTADSPPRPLVEAKLLYGEELVLPADPGGELLVTPV